jgi:hypothetical protein
MLVAIAVIGQHEVRFVIRERTLFKKIVVIILFLSFPDSNSSRGRQSRRAGEEKGQEQRVGTGGRGTRRRAAAGE